MRISDWSSDVCSSDLTSGIKVMVLAVIVGIGSNYFAAFTSALAGQEPDVDQAVSLMLASLALLGLGIFAPGIASGLVAGAPQPGAGSAIAATALAGGGLAMGGAGALAATRGFGGAGLGTIRAGTSMGAAASTAYRLGQETAGASTVRAGLGGVATAASAAAEQRARGVFGLGAAAEQGRQAAWQGSGPASAPDSQAGTDSAPAWARRLQGAQPALHRRQMAIHAVRDGERGGGGIAPDIK